jgi:hypothetical protein
LQCLLDEEKMSSVTHTWRVDERCLNLTSAALASAADEAAIVFILILFKYLQDLQLKFTDSNSR